MPLIPNVSENVGIFFKNITIFLLLAIFFLIVYFYSRVPFERVTFWQRGPQSNKLTSGRGYLIGSCSKNWGLIKFPAHLSFCESFVKTFFFSRVPSSGSRFRQLELQSKKPTSGRGYLISFCSKKLRFDKIPSSLGFLRALCRDIS